MRTKLASLICLCMFLIGCASNGVQPWSPQTAVPSARAIIVYGVAVQAPLKYPAFAVQLDEYDLAKQSISGNCISFNRTMASISSQQSVMKYFAFDVPAGHYVYSAFNTARVEGQVLAFEARAGQISYLGDFIYGDSQRVTRRESLDAAKLALRTDGLPSAREMLPANSTPVEAPKMFLCAP